MREILEQIVSRCLAGETVALCTIVASRGSTPQEKGAKMLVVADGKTIGTLGGGCVEADVRKSALEAISTGKSEFRQFKLDNDYGWDDGLICGGAVDIHIDVLNQPRTQPFARILTALNEQRSEVFRIDYEHEGQCRHFVEEVGPPPQLIIAGAGHVAQALAALAVNLDFRVTVIDDRADCASAERFPDPVNRIVGDIEAEVKRFPIDAGSFVVIVTRGHQRDGHALRAVVDSPARYVGMIGSKRKIKTIYDDLVEQGVSKELLAKVHAPIGYEIGAVTVPEIAVSIASELIAVRRGRDGMPATTMKFANVFAPKAGELQRSAAACPEKQTSTKR